MTDEAAEPESIPKLVQIKAKGPLRRLFGSVGIDSDGTYNDIVSVDPFLMCDFAFFEGLTNPSSPFCAHPHAGTAVATILVEGVPFSAWDNLQGFEKERLFPGGVYVVRTGRGCVHDEGPAPISMDQPSNAPFELPGGERPAKSFRMLQLWFDPGDIHADELPPAWTTVVQPSSVPVLTGGAMRLRLLLGRYGDCQGVDVPPTVLHGAMLPFEGKGLLQVPAGAQGFLFVMGRPAGVSVLGQPYQVGMHEELLLPKREEAYEITIELPVAGETAEAAQADEPLEVVCGFGIPSGKPFYKLLGYGGALIASSEDLVRSLMLEYEQNPRTFGVGADAEAADSSRFGLQGGYKDPMDGRGEVQRLFHRAEAPEARFFLLEKGPAKGK